MGNVWETSGKVDSQPTHSRLPVDSQWTPSGLPADSQRTPSGLPADSQQTPSWLPADSQRTPSGLPEKSLHKWSLLELSKKALHLSYPKRSPNEDSKFRTDQLFWEPVERLWGVCGESDLWIPWNNQLPK